MSNEIQTGDPATEWRRSNPDIVVYLPKEPGLNDGDNEHFLVFESPSGQVRDSKGRWLLGYSQETSKAVRTFVPVGWWEATGR